MKIKSPDKPSNQDVIWRYIGLDKLIDLLITGTFKFSLASIAADKNEIYWILKSLENNDEMKRNPTLHKSAKFYIDKIRSSTYLSCWTRKKHESRSLWANYLDSTKQGVAIKSTVDDFIKSIEWGNHGFTSHIVDYRNEFNSEELQSNIVVVNTKSTAYIEETEVRFTVNGMSDIPFNNPEDWVQKLDVYHKSVEDRPKTVEFKIDIEKMINEIFISPFCSTWQKNNIIQLINDYKPEITNRITESIINE